MFNAVCLWAHCLCGTDSLAALMALNDPPSSRQRGFASWVPDLSRQHALVLMRSIRPRFSASGGWATKCVRAAAGSECKAVPPPQVHRPRHRRNAELFPRRLHRAQPAWMGRGPTITGRGPPVHRRALRGGFLRDTPDKPRGVEAPGAGSDSASREKYMYASPRMSITSRWSIHLAVCCRSRVSRGSPRRSRGSRRRSPHAYRTGPWRPGGINAWTVRRHSPWGWRGVW